MCNKVSIIIPIYNAAPYLSRCLESIRKQTYENLEIICINDGSTDNSGEIANKFAREDSRFVVAYKQNGGESSARNTGLKMVTGDFVTFADNDDWIEPVMYQRLVEKALDTECDIIASGFYQDTDNDTKKIENTLEVTKQTFGKETLLSYVFKRDSYRGFTAYIWNKLFKTDILRSDGEPIYFDETLKICGDIVFFTKVACRVKKACYIDEVFYHHYQRDTSTSHSNKMEIQTDYLRAYDIIIDVLTNNSIGEDVMRYVKRFLVYHAIRIAGMAIKQDDKKTLLLAQGYMQRYENEYTATNQDYPERLAEFYKLKEWRA